MTNASKDRVKFGLFEADLRTRELWKNGVKLKLGGQPFEILATLLERPGELVTREQLRTRIWSTDTFVDFNHGLNAAVNKLRECLGDSAEEPRYIETLPRRGYRFIARTEKMAGYGTRGTLGPTFPLGRLGRAFSACSVRHVEAAERAGVSGNAAQACA
jgi:DNA-binding winged helix-turn-helix (wHTH) protein